MLTLSRVTVNRYAVVCAVRRLLPQFTSKPDPVYEVMPGQDLNITCTANGSPLPQVQWKKVRKNPFSALSPRKCVMVGRIRWDAVSWLPFVLIISCFSCASCLKGVKIWESTGVTASRQRVKVCLLEQRHHKC